MEITEDEKMVPIRIRRKTNKRLAMLQLQLGLNNRDEIADFLLTKYYENETDKI